MMCLNQVIPVNVHRKRFARMKNALITGASHGIGRAVAIQLAKNGYNVGINYCSNSEGAEETKKACDAFGGEHHIYKADVANLDELASMFEAFDRDLGGIDVMVNNAGISKFYPFLEVTEEQWLRLISTDFKGAYFGTQYAAKNMVRHSIKGVVINMSSNHVDGCWPGATIYGPAKAALTKFGKNASMELAEYGIRIITVAPGYTDVGWDPETGIYDVMERIPLGRFAKPEEIAAIIAFLASPACSYMTGNCVTIDGGAVLPVLTENKFFKGVEL